MKKSIYADNQLAIKLRAKGKKVRSHGSCRAKRHPTSKRLRGGIYAS